MNPKEVLTKFINETTSSSKELAKSFSKKDLRGLIGAQISQHAAIDINFAAPMGDVLSKFDRDCAASSDIRSMFTTFTKGLNNDAKRAVGSKTFSVLFELNRKFIEVLRSLDKNLDKYFQHDKLNISNMSVSSVYVAGVIGQSIALTKFLKSAIAVSSKQLGITTSMLKFDQLGVAAHGNAVAGIVNDHVASVGAFSLDSMVVSLKKSGADYALINSDLTNNIDLGFKNIPSSHRNLVTSGVLGLPLFKDIGIVFLMIRRHISQWMVTEEEWMIMHANIISSNMMGLSPEDPEYIRLQKQIDKLNDARALMEKIRSAVY